MAGPDDVKADLQAQVDRADFIGRLAERVGASARASAVFGDPVERGGLTIIPVAKATWGVGGGSGEKPGETGVGGGGGGSVVPIGYIEVRASGAEFKPIRDPRRFAVAGAAAVGLGVLAARAIARRSS